MSSFQLFTSISQVNFPICLPLRWIGFASKYNLMEILQNNLGRIPNILLCSSFHFTNGLRSLFEVKQWCDKTIFWPISSCYQVPTLSALACAICSSVCYKHHVKSPWYFLIAVWSTFNLQIVGFKISLFEMTTTLCKFFRYSFESK